MSVASDGEYLYVHTPAGLTKYGTGYRGTVAGREYLSKPHYRGSESPWVACVPPRLYLRSRAMAPDCLVVLDCATLEPLGGVRPGGALAGAADGSDSHLFPEKGVRPGGSTGGSSDRPPPEDRPDDQPQPSSQSLSLEQMHRSNFTFGGSASSVRAHLLQASRESRDSLEQASLEPDMDMSQMDYEPYTLSAVQRLQRRDRHRPRAALMSTLENLRSFTRSSREITGGSGGQSEAERRSLQEPPTPSERSPLITDGKLLYIIYKTSGSVSDSQARAREMMELRDDDEESSEGEGQIGSNWSNVVFAIDSYDPSAGMRRVRTVTISGPLCESVHAGDGDSQVCCDVCGLVVPPSAPRYRCLICSPEYDLCEQCLSRGAATLGHRPHHQVSRLDSAPVDSGRADTQRLPAFPGECLESQCFYTDGTTLMVIIQPKLFGSKIPGHLCRVFSMESGQHLYDISMGDSPDDTRQDSDPRKNLFGSCCFDPCNDLVWHVDIDGARARRWRHPWTASDRRSSPFFAVSAEPSSGDGSEGSNALESILSCLHGAAEKHARAVLELPYDAGPVWVPFCIEAGPATLVGLQKLIRPALKMLGLAPGSAVGTCTCLLREQRLALQILGTSMRLVVVNVSQATCDEDNLAGAPASDTQKHMEELRSSLLYIAQLEPRSFHESLAECAETMSVEACNALVAGLDTLFPTTALQLDLLIEHLESGQDSRVLRAIAAQFSKPGAMNLLFSILDGHWLAAHPSCAAKARCFLSLLLDALVVRESHGSGASAGDAGTGEAGVSWEEVGDSEDHLVSLLAALQRGLLSVPYSAARATHETEELLFFHARALLDRSSAAIGAMAGAPNGKGLGFVRVLLPPLVTALADTVWAQNLSRRVTREELPTLLPLLESLDRFNHTHAATVDQDAAFSLKCTESKVIGARVVSVSRTRHQRPVAVKFPGAAHIVVHIHDDVTLRRKETLKIHRDSEAGPSVSTTIKSHRGRRNWRCFRVQGDALSLSYEEYKHASQIRFEEYKHARQIRCTLVAYAHNAAVRAPLGWLLDLELAVADLAGKALCHALREDPLAAAAPGAAPTSALLFSEGASDAWPRAHCPELCTGPEPPGAAAAYPAHGAFLAALVEPPTASADGAAAQLPFARVLDEQLGRAVALPDWLDGTRARVRALGRCVSAALLHVAGLAGAAQALQPGATAQPHAEEVAFVAEQAAIFVQRTVLEARKRLQGTVSCAGDEPSDKDAMEDAQPDLGTLKKQAAEHAEARVAAMTDRCHALLASNVPQDADALGVLLDAFGRLGGEDEGQCRVGSGGEGDRMAALRYGVGLVTQFVASDVRGQDVLAIPRACLRACVQRREVVAAIRALLGNVIAVSSVRQLLLSVFMLGPAEQEHRFASILHIAAGLQTCPRAELAALRAEWARLVSDLARCLRAPQSGAPPDRAAVSMQLLVLGAVRRMRLDEHDLPWLAGADLVPSLGALVSRWGTLEGTADAASPARVSTAERETVAGLLDCAKAALQALTLDCARLPCTAPGSRAALARVLAAAVQAAAQALTALEAAPAGEARDARQLDVLAWLHALVCAQDAATAAIVGESPAVAALLRCALHADAPAAQRAAMAVLVRAFAGEAAGALLRAAPVEETRALLRLDGASAVAAVLAQIGRVAEWAPHGPMAEVEAAGAAKEREGADRHSPGSRGRRAPAGGTGRWMVLAVPAHADALSLEDGESLGAACRRALAGAARGERAGPDPAAKCAEVVKAVSAGERACVLVGAYEECQACCLRWSCAAAHVIVARCGAAEAPPHVWRWRSGNVRVALARDQTSFLRALAATESLGPALADELESALEAAAAALPRLSGVAGADEHRAALEAGCAALEVLSAAHTGVGVRVGAWVKMPRGPPGGRSVQQRGLVVACDHVVGSVAVLPEEAVEAHVGGVPGHAAAVPTKLTWPAAHQVLPPQEGAAGAWAAALRPLALPPAAAASLADALSRVAVAAAQACATAPAGPPAPVLPALRARALAAVAALLEEGAVLPSRLLPAGGVLAREVFDAAAQHPTARPVALELRRDALAAHLCSPAKGAPTALLARASAPWPGGGGSGDSGERGTQSGSTASLRGQRHAHSGGMDTPLFRPSSSRGSGMRGDQRRRSEVAASMLAEMTCLPVPLCQFALERENGNSDRAANWLFEHSDTWLAEHPEFAGGGDGGGDGPDGAAGSGAESEAPACPLRDAYSYQDDTPAQGGGDESDGGLAGLFGAGEAGRPDIPHNIMAELEAIGYRGGLVEAGGVSDERLNSMLGRSARMSASQAARRAQPDPEVRAGMCVALAEVELQGAAGRGGLGVQRLAGRALFVVSLDAAAETALVQCYDAASAAVLSHTVPTASLESLPHPSPPAPEPEAGNVDALIRAGAEANARLAAVHARACVRMLLAHWPADAPLAERERSLGGRARLQLLMRSVAAASADYAAEAQVGSAAGRPGSADGGAVAALSELLLQRTHAMLAVETREEPCREEGARPPSCAPAPADPLSLGSPDAREGRPKREREGETPASDGKRRRGALVAAAPGAAEGPAGGEDPGFHKHPGVERPEQPSLAESLADLCVTSLRAAAAAAVAVEEASEHPWSRGSSGPPGVRRCLQVEAAGHLFVVFDPRCVLLPGESMRFYANAACTELVAAATQDDRRKGFLPLTLPSPVWMAVHSAAAQGGSDDGESAWGYRLLAAALGEPHLALALWLAELFSAPRAGVGGTGALLLPRRRVQEVLEAALDLLAHGPSLAAPHCAQLHAWTCRLVAEAAGLPDCTTLLETHPAFDRLAAEAAQRHDAEKRLVAAARGAADWAHCPLSTHLCSLAELLATRALALDTLGKRGAAADAAATSQDQIMILDPCGAADSGERMELDGSEEPGVFRALRETLRISARLYRGKQHELDAIVAEGAVALGEDAALLAAPQPADAYALLDAATGDLSPAARETLLELLEEEPSAQPEVSRLLAGAQSAPGAQAASRAAKLPREFLAQARALAAAEPGKLAELLASLDVDAWLVRWSPERDAELVALVNMLADGGGTPPGAVPVATVVLSDQHARRLPRLAAVPTASLRRRVVLLKLLNSHLARALFAVDLSSRASVVAGAVCEMQHLLFYATKSAFHSAILDWTSCAAGRYSDRNVPTVQIHRPGRRAREKAEKAEEHERWRLRVALGARGPPEELLVAPADFGSAREMPADRTLSGRLVLADPPNGALPLRNGRALRGNIALVERGGGQFVHVVRRAQEAGAAAVVIADSREGPLFLMSTELGASGDDVTIPAVLLSLADSMLLDGRGSAGGAGGGGALRASIRADGVLMQTYRQLRVVAPARLRQREEIAWRVIFHGEGHQGYQGPYREALTALCLELQSPALGLLVPCANAASSVATNRDKFVPRPSARSALELDLFFFLGQLMAVAMRTRNLLSIDLPSLVWKALVGHELEVEDLQATDLACWSSLQFRDEDGQPISAQRFPEIWQCCFTTCLTDGSSVELIQGGARVPVTFERRAEYAALVVQARLHESRPQLARMREGLVSIVPAPLLALLTPEELERRVCGSPEIDVASLRRHTRYRGGVAEDQPHVQLFWEVLEEMEQADRRLFLRFAWGRERLPLESDYTEQSEMKVFPSDRGDGDKVLPEAETCFFIVKLPRYRSKELMRDNLLAAITACREINY